MKPSFGSSGNAKPDIVFLMADDQRWDISEWRDAVLLENFFPTRSPYGLCQKRSQHPPA
jgi:hypothetical protein